MSGAAEPDWRIDFAAGLAGYTLHRRRYTRWSATWDHDHCTACWATFMENNDPASLHEGYTTGADHPNGDGYWWVCETCFTDLQSELKWRAT